MVKAILLGTSSTDSGHIQITTNKVSADGTIIINHENATKLKSAGHMVSDYELYSMPPLVEPRVCKCL